MHYEEVTVLQGYSKENHFKGEHLNLTQKKLGLPYLTKELAFPYTLARSLLLAELRERR